MTVQLPKTTDPPTQLNQTIHSWWSAFWEILRHELLYITWALMDVSVITPVVLAFSPWTRFWPPAVVALWLLFLMLIPLNLSRIATIYELRVEHQQIILVIGLLIALFFACRILLFRPDQVLDVGWIGDMFRQIGQANNPYWSRMLAVFGTMAVTWWRGISLAGRPVDIDDIGFRMRFGILVVVALVAGLAGSITYFSVVPFILLYFFAALISIVLTRVEQLELSKGDESFPLRFRWLATVSIAATLVVLSTGILASFIGGESIFQVMGWFTPFWWAWRFILSAVAITVAYLLTPLLMLFEWLLLFLQRLLAPVASQLGLEEIPLIEIQPIATPNPDEVMDVESPFLAIPDQLLPILVMLFLVLLVSLALGRLVRITRRSRRVESKSINPLTNLKYPDRLGLGGNLLRRLGFRRWRAAATIRNIYRQMSQVATEAGFSRAHFETPIEYLSTLYQAWPEYRDQTRLITEAYNRVRYGEIPETREELDAIISAWKILEKHKPEPVLESRSDVAALRLDK